MTIKFQGPCQWVRKNNGIVKAIFTSRPHPDKQQESAIVNVVTDDLPKEGLEYVVIIQPAFPH